VQISSINCELMDRGPEFIRCGIKSVELLDLQHLSLPDNMLSINEAKMIAKMLEKNPPLKSLNLHKNKLNYECGKFLGQALAKNSNL
jgi:Ran GTPase-activating protein (RanGAP) involved in mRNA processing and transport